MVYLEYRIKKKNFFLKKGNQLEECSRRPRGVYGEKIGGTKQEGQARPKKGWG